MDWINLAQEEYKWRAFEIKVVIFELHSLEGISRLPDKMSASLRS